MKTGYRSANGKKKAVKKDHDLIRRETNEALSRKVELLTRALEISAKMNNHSPELYIEMAKNK